MKVISIHFPVWKMSIFGKENSLSLTSRLKKLEQGILKGKYHCTTDLLFDWFGLVCFANKNKNCQLSYS
jgi:hypothetical protein